MDRLDKDNKTTSQVGYVPPAQNPYISAVESGQDPLINKVDEGYVAPHNPLEDDESASSQNKEKNKKTFKIFLICIAILAVIIFIFRPVEVLVNGKRKTYTAGTKIEEVFEDCQPEIKPGNLVSVNKKVIKQKAGQPYALKVNGKAIAFKDAGEYKIKNQDKVEFLDGKDIMEKHSVEVKEEDPKLVVDGDTGSIAYISQWGQKGKYEVLTGEISHETCKGKWVTEPKDCVIKVCNVHPKDNKKLVALTFDDGPSQYTSDILNVLKQNNVKATFCVGADQAIENPMSCHNIIDGGNQIIGHVYQGATKGDHDALGQYISKNFNALKKACDVDTSIVRAGYGVFNSDTWLDSKGSVLAVINWTQDSRDWSLSGVSNIINNSCSDVTSGSIILLHDGGGNRQQTVDALPGIISKLKEQGYEFVTISELLQSDTNIAKSITSEKAKMPKGAVWPQEVGINW